MNYYIIVGILLVALVTVCILSVSYHEPYNRSEIKFNNLPIVDKTTQYKHAKVLIFNSYAYSDKIPEYATHSSLITKAYADNHGYDYKQYNHTPDIMPPYWLRVKDTYDVLMSGDYDVVMYLDLDATVHDFDLPINDVIADNKYDFYIGADPLGFDRPDFNNLVNTGCFIVKNTVWARLFIQMWMNACMNKDGNLSGICESSWKFIDKKWNCSDCKWAGLKYEQGALANLYIMNVNESRDHICIFEESIMSNKFPEKKSYILHLMGSTNNERTKIFKNLAELI